MDGDSILVTGARGYLGACVVRELAQRELPVVPLTCRLEQIAPRSLNVGTVIHCAGALRHRPDEHDSANRAGTATLLQGLRQRETRVLFLSSRGVYAPSDLPLIDESAPVGPSDSYGQSKLQAEQLIHDSGHPWLILRPTTLIGRGVDQPGRSFVSSALESMRAGREVVLHTPDREIDFLDVNDLARVIAYLLFQPESWGAIYNAAAPARSLHGLMRRLAQAVETADRISPRLLSEPGPPSRAPLLDSSRLLQQLSTFPCHDDEQTCRELVAGAIG